MKTSILHLMIFSNIIFYSCDFNDQTLEYEENLVVFGSIVANLPVNDTVSVSRSASIDEDIQAQDLWIDDASVYIIDDSTKDSLHFFNVGSGKYFPLPTEPEFAPMFFFSFTFGTRQSCEIIDFHIFLLFS